MPQSSLDPNIAFLLRNIRALPAFTIHSIVRYAGRAFKSAKTPNVRAWGPTVTGLAVVPILPYLFDKPIEHMTDSAADWLEHRWYEHKAEQKKLNKDKDV